MDPTIDNVEYLHTNGSITQEAYSVIISHLMQVDQPPPPPVRQPQHQPLPMVPPGPGPPLPPGAAPPLPGPSRATSVASPGEPYIVDSPSTDPQRGSVNQAVYDYLSEYVRPLIFPGGEINVKRLPRKRIGDITNQLLKIHPFLGRSDRKALSHAVRRPLAKGVAAATTPSKQARLRQSTGQSLSSAGRSTSSALKSIVPKKEKSSGASGREPSAVDALANDEHSFQDFEIESEDGEDPRFIRAMSSTLDIAPGLQLTVDTIVRVVLDSQVLLDLDAQG